MDIISFSLYGDNPKYCQGMIQNAILAKYVFPLFQVRVYFNDTVPAEILQHLQALDCQLVDMTDHPLASARMFWRLLPMEDPGVNIFLARDADSRLSLRDRKLFDLWHSQHPSGFYTIHDHPYHVQLISGGLFGGYSRPLLGALEQVKTFPSVSNYGDDEAFLGEIVYPLIRDELTDFRFDATPVPFDNYQYLGEPYYAFERYDAGLRAALKSSLDYIAQTRATSSPEMLVEQV